MRSPSILEPLSSLTASSASRRSSISTKAKKRFNMRKYLVRQLISRTYQNQFLCQPRWLCQYRGTNHRDHLYVPVATNYRQKPNSRILAFSENFKIAFFWFLFFLFCLFSDLGVCVCYSHSIGQRSMVLTIRRKRRLLEMTLTEALKRKFSQ